jgi:hypothetical protein
MTSSFVVAEYGRDPAREEKKLIDYASCAG